MATHLVVGTAGHIDHGKSALVLALTGTDPDRLREEKARGITIDLGFAHTTEGDVVLSFVDVPGHERFVKNMLAGAGGIDAVMLHVAADESVMPQTREHFDICRLLRVPAGLIVITKADLVDPDTLDVVRLEVEDLVRGSFLEGAPVMAVSARTGLGVQQLRRALAGLARTVARRSDAGAPRLPIDRAFSIRGFGTVVTGTLVAGHLTVEDELVLLPSGRPAKVRGLQVHGRPCRRAAAGQRVAANLAGVDVADVGRGDTLTAPDRVTVTRRLDAVVELLPDGRPLRQGVRLRFHQGTRELSARIALPSSGDLPPGAAGCARLHLDAPAALVRGDRFILRASSPLRTIGGGTVLDPLPPRRGVRTPAAATRFARLAAGLGAPGGAGDVTGALLAVIDEQDVAGLPVPQLVGRLGVEPGNLAGTLERLVQSGVRAIDGVLYHAPRLAALEERTLALVADHHARAPLDEGIPREELRERLFRRAAPALFDDVLGRLVESKRLVARDRVALASHTLALGDEDARVRDAIVQVLEASGLAPPDPADLAVRVNTTAQTADRLARLLVRQGVVVRAGDLLFHNAVLDRLKAEVRAGKAHSDTLDVAAFKVRFDISRKYAIPLLEYLDRERVTRRVGDRRKIL